jgi:hypothetical protein
VLAVPVIAFTVAVLVADTAKTSSWTLARQNLDALRGDVRCGLADSAVVPVRASMHALALVGAAGLEPPAPWLPPAPAPGLDRFTLSPPGTPALPSRSPWFRLRSGQHTGFFLAGIPAATETLELEWGRIQGTRIASMAASVVAGDAATDARPDLSFWRFYAAGNLPPPPSGANTVRFSLSSEGPGQPIGLSAPVTYSDEPLASLLEREVPALALPNLLTFVPCIRQPQVGDTAEVPHLILAFRDSMWPLGTGTSPFDGLPSLYRFVRLPLSDSADPPGDVAVYAVDRRIDGAAIAPPLAASTG